MAAAVVLATACSGGDEDTGEILPELPPLEVAHCGMTTYELRHPFTLGQPVLWREHPLFDFSSEAMDEFVSQAGFESLTPLPNGVKLFQYRYTTQDRGEAVEATGLIGIPTDPSAGERAEPWPVVLFLHGFVGATDPCAPSDNGMVGPVQAALVTAHGYVVVAPDYIGMNGLGDASTAPHGPLIGEQIALGSWDGLRAGLSLLDTDLQGYLTGERRQDVVIWGASQGGHGAFFTELYGPYVAPDIEVAAVVASSPATDLRAVVAHGMEEYGVPTTLSALALVGMRRWYGTPSSMHGVLTNTEPDYIADRIEQVLTETGDECAVEAEVEADSIEEIYEASFIEAVRGEDWDSILPWSCFIDTNSASRSTIAPLRRTPLLAVYGSADPLVAPEHQYASFDALCSDGWTLDFLECEGAEHGETTIWSIPDQKAWVEDRLAGVALPESEICHREAPIRCSATPD